MVGATVSTKMRQQVTAGRQQRAQQQQSDAALQQQLTQAINSNPVLQQAIQDAHGNPHRNSDLTELARAQGIQIPKGLSVHAETQNGQPGASVRTNQGIKWWMPLLALGPVGVAIAAPAIAGALGAGAGASTGAGAGAWGPLAGGYAGATTEAAVPASLAAIDAAAPAAAAGAASAYGPLANGYGAATTEAAVPEALARTGAAASTTGTAANLLKYGAPVVGGAIDAIEQNANREQQQKESDQRTAVLESGMDPFRGLMNQTNDLATLEKRSAGPRVYRPSASSPYASSYNAGNEAPPLSDIYRTSLSTARDMIARGQGTVPTMLDPNNWGQNGTANLTAPAPSAPTAMPAPAGMPPGTNDAALGSPWTDDPNAPPSASALRPRTAGRRLTYRT
jgi:hypothetical protein